MMQELAYEIKKLVQRSIKGIHTAMPGVILSFNPESGLASVLPSAKYRKPDGTSVDYPQITGVPVLFPQSMAQNAAIAFPVKAGDGCLIVFAEQSIDYWMYGQETSTDLAFDLTNAVCIPGLYAAANPFMKDACDSNSVIIGVNGTKISMTGNGIEIDSDRVVINGNLTVNGHLSSPDR